MTRKKLSILIAAYNEEVTIRVCLEGVLAAPICGLDREIIVVNDASTDETGLILDALAIQYPEIRHIRQEKNQGKGAAIRRAVQEASGDLAIWQDADLEYDPQDYPKLLQPILDEKADVVFGSRFTGEVRKVLYFWHSLGNGLLTLLSNAFNDINLTDMETCYKAFRLDLLKRIPLVSNRFGIEPEITAKVAHNRWRIYEVPINYHGRTYEEGKKIGWKDGVAAFWFILKFSFPINYTNVRRTPLSPFESSSKLNQWTFATIKPWLGQRIAELGSGKGNITRWLKTTSGAAILATDASASNVDQLSGKFGQLQRVRVRKLDPTVSGDYGALASFQPDTVVCLHVLELIEQDADVLKQLFASIPFNCRIIFLVPRGQKLWRPLDTELGRVRRYEKGELRAKVQAAGFTVEKLFTFNRAGTPSWIIRNKFGGPHGKFYNFMSPFFQTVEGILPWPGLSLICVARKVAASDGVPASSPASRNDNSAVPVTAN